MYINYRFETNPKFFKLPVIVFAFLFTLDSYINHMPTAISVPSQSTMPSPVKWNSRLTKTTRSGRVHKRTSSASSSASSRVSQSSRSCKKQARTPNTRANEIKRLESEISFTYETVATISIMLDSLRNAYATSKPEMDKSWSETRLSDMEKELLAAYDDLALQVLHLERQIVKLEKRLSDLKSSSSPLTPSTATTHKPTIKQEPEPPFREFHVSSPASASTIDTANESPAFLSYPPLPTPPASSGSSCMYSMPVPETPISYFSAPQSFHVPQPLNSFQSFNAAVPLTPYCGMMQCPTTFDNHLPINLPPGAQFSWSSSDTHY